MYVQGELNPKKTANNNGGFFARQMHLVDYL